jgi:hypothetical protein
MLLASINGNVTVLQYLLSCGGDPAAPTTRGTMPLHNAAELVCKPNLRTSMELCLVRKLLWLFLI